MSRKTPRTYSRTTLATLELLAQQIQAGRKARRYSQSALAERVGIARSTLQLIEAADPRVEIGLYFEAAVLVGVNLYGAEGPSPARQAHFAETLALLPRSVQPPRHADDVDDF